MGLTWVRGMNKPKEEAAGGVSDGATAIMLRIEDGLLMAFGPEGDPVPPSLVRSTLEEGSVDRLPLDDGRWVEGQRAVTVLEAQQRAPLSERRHDGWIEAMLMPEKAFEATPPDLLANEPSGPTPPLCKPEDERSEPEHLVSEWVTPLAFDAEETASIAEADALLIRGLRDGLSLSAGHFDPALNAWVVLPSTLQTLLIKRPDGAPSQAEISVSAISTDGAGKRWPVVNRQIELA